METRVILPPRLILLTLYFFLFDDKTIFIIYINIFLKTSINLYYYNNGFWFNTSDFDESKEKTKGDMNTSSDNLSRLLRKKSVNDEKVPFYLDYSWKVYRQYFY